MDKKYCHPYEQWAYMMESNPSFFRIQELGLEGWELVALNSVSWIYYFKRPLLDEKEYPISDRK
jgi:hypothetical protein